MARDFDNFPTYDPVIKQNDVYLSGIWADFMATFVESLQGYLSQNGMFVPVLTVAQQNAILNPQEGQMIYVGDAIVQDVGNTAQLQIWQVVQGVGQWTVIV
jgi:hypothetical protein